MSVRASVFQTIFSNPGMAWPWAVLLAPVLAAAVGWQRFYRRITVPDVSADWLERHTRDAPKHG